MKIENGKIYKRIIFLSIVLILAVLVISIMMKYQVEGEKNMPFTIAKVMVLSTVEGIQKHESEEIWNLDLFQNNDIYLKIEKNKNYPKEEIIKEIALENIQILTPEKGNIAIYKPKNEQGEYERSAEYEIKKEIIYQGRTLLFRISNENIGEYISNEDTEVRHDGTLLQKIGITNEQIKITVTFDIKIILESGKEYKGSMNLDLPVGNFIEEGVTSLEKTDFTDVIFKRQ